MVEVKVVDVMVVVDVDRWQYVVVLGKAAAPQLQSNLPSASDTSVQVDGLFAIFSLNGSGDGDAENEEVAQCSSKVPASTPVIALFWRSSS